MHMKTRTAYKYFLLILILWGHKTWAQTTDYSQAYYGNLSMTPIPSPSVAPFVNYVQPNVNEFYGTVGTEVPLHTVQYGNISLPIKIVYSSKGKSAFGFQSRMGEGFSLVAGGVISRKVRRLPDDNFRGLDKWDWDPQTGGKPREATVQAGGYPGLDYYGWAELKTGSGFCFNSGIRSAMNNLFIYGYEDNGSASNNLSSTDFISQNNLNVVGNSVVANDRARYAISATYGHIDTEPDIFSYNFGGYSGSFYFDNAGFNIIESNKSGLRFSYTWSKDPNNPLQNDKINSFTITTKEGLEYVFSEKEYTWNQPFSKTYPTNQNWNLHASVNVDLNLPNTPFVKDPEYISAWFLSAIKRNSETIISFVYEDNNYEAINGLSFNKTTRTVSPFGFTVGWSSTRSLFKTKILKEIKCPDMDVLFSYDPSTTVAVPPIGSSISTLFYEPLIKRYNGMSIRDNKTFALLKNYQFKYVYGFQETYLDSVIQKSVMPNDSKKTAYHLNIGIYHGLLEHILRMQILYIMIPFTVSNALKTDGVFTIKKRPTSPSTILIMTHS